ncbi:hypothetical protein F5Y17DRAFT_433276 [Xylariaceae sp. FL0594]|nr:hypothetical protein F5Y17DRAFT_433276 [Xylariaceae sp. FL0594]
MCILTTEFNHCYTCSREFDHKRRLFPCPSSYSLQPPPSSSSSSSSFTSPIHAKACTNWRSPYYPLIHTSETCAPCTRLWFVKEECMRTFIYRQRPLRLDAGDERMRAFR